MVIRNKGLAKKKKSADLPRFQENGQSLNLRLWVFKITFLTTPFYLPANIKSADQLQKTKGEAASPHI